jgi:heme-degrading monooxygenase HmoA
MYIAMNRFRIALGSEEVFEKLWRERDSYLEGEPGFESFHLLKGATDEEGTLYASHTVWASEADFRAWTESESFKKAHAQARAPQGTYLGHPVFEGFEAIL